MKLHLIFFAGILLSLCAACNGAKTQKLESKNGFAVLPKQAKGEEIAAFAGGCFWAMQESMLELKGVHKVISGYAGGTADHPTYDAVLTKQTGHAEAVLLYYNPAVISFEKLAEAFFYAHDPTQLNSQGPDVGSDYRSIAFYRSPEELKSLIKVVDQVDHTGYYTSPIVTELLPFAAFYPAEMEHQDYFVKNPWSIYIKKVSKPKVLKLRAKMSSLIKPEYLYK
ncbi:peptide-methionine (S)-S-oxide reductase MsrA [Pedobacter sp. MC2016-14]|uniref:peptide-methionine (S)-S-oxide reductase MsrA n=1 Tax=Pedobacter sp. MC2016-14 TaxID=2897327 RepID=UPI001E5245FA|nr:peptide-methionine (S)-S-oxide reductase MsrA [Pedobacter sp. MC2016-14]MCD0490204.1 peptide-methionine (S)-S-oxide reductase MsrA [Pedobacter sp. MC2016-14]